MGIWAEIKHALNNTLGTSYFSSFDKLIPAKIFIKGVKGEIFNFSNEELGIEFDVAMDENTPIGTSGFREITVPVALGTWKITIALPEIGTDMQTVSVENIGVAYPVPYTIQDTNSLIEFEEGTGTYTIQDDIESVIILACGAGGGGGSGYSYKAGTYSYGYGGSGGGGGSAVKKAIPLISVEERTLNVTIGAGGIGAPATESISRDNGTDGGATILTGIVNCTLAGGGGGISNDSKTVSPGGSSGGPGGGSGGNCGYFSYAANDYYKDGTDGEDGLLGKGGKYYNTGGGGGASIGDGGSNEYDVYDGNDGIRGGGGSGGGGSSSKAGFSGGNGGNGYLSIYKGVMIE